jgi:site-specific recombinase XerD
MEAFRLWMIEQDLAANTIKGYLGQMRKFAVWFEQTNGEALTGPNLTSTDVREYRGYRLARQDTAPGTVNLALAALRIYGRWLVATGQVSANPAKGVREVRLQKPPIRWLDRQAQAKLMREFEKDVQAARTDDARCAAIRNHSLFVFLVNSGLRVSEVCDLIERDVKIGERSGSVYVRLGKDSKARHVQLNRHARQAVTDWLAVRPANDDPHIFIGRRRTSLKPRDVQKMIGKMAKRVGLKVTPHQLRHTFAKNLVNAGADLDQVRILMGHDSLNTTAVYITPSAHDLELAVAALED